MHPVVETTEHEHTLYAEQLTSVYGLPITNALLGSWVALIIIIVLAILVRVSIRLIPGKMQSIWEIICEQCMDLCDQVTNSREISESAFPIAIAIFIFVLINDWVGILPGIGSILVMVDGHSTALLRGATADINTTLALSLFSVVVANLLGIVSIGLWNTITKFIAVPELIKFKEIVKKPTLLIQIPVNIFIGLLELLGEFAKIAALSFRLFGNVFAGEVLLAAMAALIAYGVPVPFLFLEFFVGIIQAFIISLLTVVYITLAMQMHSSSDH
jgi:F-type H+-transporting ATPase subunit a